MSSLQLVLLIAIVVFLCIALGVAAWAINALDRRVTQLEGEIAASKRRETTLVAELRQVFDAMNGPHGG